MNYLKLIVGYLGIVFVFTYLFYLIGGVSMQVQIFAIVINCTYSTFSDKSTGICHYLIRESINGQKI